MVGGFFVAYCVESRFDMCCLMFFVIEKAVACCDSLCL